MLKQSKHPYGYRNLLVYPVRSQTPEMSADAQVHRTSNGVNKKAEELQMACAGLTRQFPKTKTLIALSDQMDRSARSTKQNIAEGWKRNTTNEYYQFLGFALASNAELEEDCNDIWKGIYSDLMTIKGVMGEKREEKGEKY